jgi:hypothetical protein
MTGFFAPDNEDELLAELRTVVAVEGAAECLTTFGATTRRTGERDVDEQEEERDEQEVEDTDLDLEW